MDDDEMDDEVDDERYEYDLGYRAEVDRRTRRLEEALIRSMTPDMRAAYTTAPIEKAAMLEEQQEQLADDRDTIIRRVKRRLKRLLARHEDRKASAREYNDE